MKKIPALFKRVFDDNHKYRVLLRNTDSITSVCPVTIHGSEVFSTGTKMNGGVDT